jgi:hypothetical protein
MAGALGVAAPSVALAQGAPAAKSESHAAASKPGGVAGVVVQAPPKTTRIPPDKKAAFDAAAAKRKAWKRYRATTPTPTVAAGATSPASETAAARAENYPGLHTLGSH